jgi:putative nucleotidyltransferase with HDIG domain
VSEQIREQERRRKAEQQRERALVRLRRTVESAARTLAGAVEMRDLYTAGHQDRVTQLVDRLAESLELRESARAALHIAALIHDLGKLSIPAEILTKPGKLSALEFDLLRQHSESGYQLVRQMHFPGAVADIVRQHHERLDGSGYPLGLKGDQIRLESRIVAIADVVEAMSSHRPYRPALGIEAALAEIEANRGTLYDPLVADACLALFHEEGFAFGSSAAVHLPI